MSRNRISIWIVLILMGSCVPKNEAQGVPSTGGISLFVQSKSGEMVDGLKASDIKVLQGGKQIPSIVRRAAPVRGSAGTVPTYVLVVLDPSLKSVYNSPSEILRKLEPLWAAGFAVSIAMPDLTASSFTRSRDTARLEIEGLKPSGTGLSGVSDTIAKLDVCDGRRVLLYIAGDGGMDGRTIPKELVAGASAVRAQVYVVDGAFTGGDFDSIGPKTRVSGSDLGSLPTTTELGLYAKWYSPARNVFRAGVAHEQSLKDAVNRIEADAGGYFDVTLQCPTASCIRPNEPVVVQIRRPGPMRVTAEGSGAASGAVLQVEVR